MHIKKRDWWDKTKTPTKDLSEEISSVKCCDISWWQEGQIYEEFAEVLCVSVRTDTEKQKRRILWWCCNYAGSADVELN